MLAGTVRGRHLTAGDHRRLTNQPPPGATKDQQWKSQTDRQHPPTHLQRPVDHHRELVPEIIVGGSGLRGLVPGLLVIR